MNGKFKMNAGNTSPWVILTIVFIVLKLTGVIDWSWFYVLLPTIIPLAIAGIILLGIGGIFLYHKIKNR